jgi:ammonia channel protein AmtB
MELSQAGKKNRDYIVLKNMIILLICLLCWFTVGFAIAFGTNEKSDSIQFAGLYYGYFGDLSGGLSNQTDTSRWPTE